MNSIGSNNRRFLPKHLFIFCYFPLSIFANIESDSPNELTPVIVTAKGGFSKPLASTPWSSTILNADSLSARARSMPEILSGQPSVMVQKTALGQSSPYIRGFTGYHNMLLVDGIRLNHSAMRSGPNQYWSTVGLLGVNRIELVRGPNGIMYGADTVGGVVNILSSEPEFSKLGLNHSGSFMGRVSSAEHSWSAELNGNISTPKWSAQLSHAERTFGDLEGGRNVGRQVNTGYNSNGTQFRVSRKLLEDMQFTLGFQQSFMNDVPRTHKTIDGLSWNGLSPGSDIWRKLDQERKLYYSRLSWKDSGGWVDSGIITLNLHQHEQERDRMKGNSTGNATGGDFQFFNLDDFGLTARFESDDPWGGRISYGAEWHRESLSSGGYKFDTNQVRGDGLGQGSLAADAVYHRYAFYLNDTYETSFGLIIEPGIRFSAIKADLNRYYLENSDLSTIQGPETKKYQEVIGSLRISQEVMDHNFLFTGLSQGFRPPSLYDLTSTDETSVNESPNVNLYPETFLQSELGIRGKSGSWDWIFSAYHTWINDLIVRSPEHPTINKENTIKSNGDGYLQGLEIEFGYNWNPSWRSEFSFSSMYSQVEQLIRDDLFGSVEKLVDDDQDSSTPKTAGRFIQTERVTTRLMPTQVKLLTRYDPPLSPWFMELSLLHVADADKLSLKDETDSSRIPINGTPGYSLLGFEVGHELGKSSLLFLNIGNIADVDYRVHGSGLNGAGRNFILSLIHYF